MDELDKLSLDPDIFPQSIQSSFACAYTYPGFKTTKTFTLEVDRSRMWEHEEATFFALDIIGLIFNLLSIEEVTLRGIPSLELSSIFEFLHCAPIFELPACAPTLRIIKISHRCWSFSFPFVSLRAQP